MGTVIPLALLFGTVAIVVGRAYWAQMRELQIVEMVLRNMGANQVGRIGGTVEGNVRGIQIELTILRPNMALRPALLCEGQLPPGLSSFRIEVRPKQALGIQLSNAALASAVAADSFECAYHVDSTESRLASAALDARVKDALLYLRPCRMTMSERQVKVEKCVTAPGEPAVHRILELCLNAAERIVALEGNRRAAADMPPYR